MFEIDENNLPFVRTRQALLILDLQNDFVSTGGILPVENPPNFVENILSLLPDFRPSGNIIWIRSVFEASRPVNLSHGESESVITDSELCPRKRGGDAHLTTPPRPSQKLLDHHGRIAEANGRRSERSPALEVDEDETDVVEETYLTLNSGQKPQIVLLNSPGSNLCQAASEKIDKEKDVVFQKSWYSAFKDGSLVQILRAKFVTDIYICGSLTNISVFATTMDAARHGYGITIIDDCLGYRSKARHDEALRRLTEFTGCDITNSEDLVEEIRRKARRSQAPPRRHQRPPQRNNNRSGLENLMANLNLRLGGSALQRGENSTGSPDNVAAAMLEPQDVESFPTDGDRSESPELKLPIRPTEGDGKKRERVKTKIKTRRRHSPPRPRETGESSNGDKVPQSPTSTTLLAASQALENLPVPLSEDERSIADSQSSSTTQETMGGKSRGRRRGDDGDEMDALCEGDTTIIHDLLDTKTAEGIFDKIRDEVRWQKMSHQGGDVPRLVAVQGDIGEDGSHPIYRHPADESPQLLPFSKNVLLIREEVERKLGHSVNHVLIQFYRDGTDHISEHSDKTLDIVHDTYIANVSLGAQRTMVFRTKKADRREDVPEPETTSPRKVCRAPLPHNSLCRMGLVTNMRWLHGIRQDKRMEKEKSEEELAYDGGRISLTFRLIGTFLDKDQRKIWGQGAVAKTKPKARPVINGNKAESEKMIRAFSRENHASEFNWQEIYGNGSDVLHCSNDTILFLSGDFSADLRVKILLAEYGISWKEGHLSPSFNWKNGSTAADAPPVPTNLPVKFVDNDMNHSTVEGDVAIMLYLDSVYGSRSNASSASKSQVELAKQFTRLQQSNDLLKKWRTRPLDIIAFRREIVAWDPLAAESTYMAGDTVSLADFALFPVLEEIRGEWKNAGGLEHLVRYFFRVRMRETVISILGPMDEVIMQRYKMMMAAEADV